MTDDPTEGVPDADPDIIDPAGDIANLVESGNIDMELSDDQDREDLREFIESVEQSDDLADPGTNATLRIARSLLESETESDE